MSHLTSKLKVSVRKLEELPIVLKVRYVHAEGDAEEEVTMATQRIRPYVRRRDSILLGHRVLIPCSSHFNQQSLSCIVTIDLNNDTWQSELVSGPCRFSGKGFLYEDTILWVGSRDFSGEQTGKMILTKYDLVTKEWLPCLSTGVSPPERYGFSADFIPGRNRFVVIGGKQNVGPTLRYLEDVQLLDVQRKRWIQPVVKGTPPSKRSIPSSCVHNGSIYYYGGSYLNHRLADGIFVLQVSSRNVATWSKPKLVLSGSYLWKLGAFAFVPFQGALIFCGGLNTARRTLQVYDPKTGELSHVSPGTPGDFKGYGTAISALTFNHGKVIGVFGRRGLHNYTRISLTD